MTPVLDQSSQSLPASQTSPEVQDRADSAPPAVQVSSNDAAVEVEPQRDQQLPPGFSPDLGHQSLDAAIHRLRKGDKVRILHPTTNKVTDVTIRNGFTRKAQLSKYRFDGPLGIELLDFNKLIWEKLPPSAEAMMASNDKVFKVNHQIIRPQMHHLPEIVNAKYDEINNHIKFGTFKLVDEHSLTAAQRENIISSTWAVVWKGTPTEGRYKARLCARGDLEKNVDKLRTDAPTACKDFIRILLTIGASNKWTLHSLDFTSAFIQGRQIDRELFLRPPKDVRLQNPNKLFKVVKRIYGLRDASRGWVEEISGFLVSIGMERSQMDKAVFYYKEQGKLQGIIACHIDDFLYSGSESFHKNIIDKVKKKYVIGTIEDTVLTFTGWNLKQDNSGIELSQHNYLDNICLDKFQHFANFTAKDTERLGESDQSCYRKIVGILNWMISTSKPGLSHACNVASTKLGKATKADAKQVYRTLLKAKADHEVIKFSNLGDPKTWVLDIYTDAALGKPADADTFIGDITFFKSKNNVRNVINWSAGKLDVPTVGILSGEAEAITNGYGKISYLKYIFNEMYGTEIEATINTDSKSLYQTVLSDNSIRNRRISAAIATIRAIRTKDKINLVWVKGIANLADPLTKPNANLANLKSVLSTGKMLPGLDTNLT